MAPVGTDTRDPIIPRIAYRRTYQFTTRFTTPENRDFVYASAACLIASG